MNTTLKATLAFSLTASILFSATSPVFAVGKSEQAHQHASGWMKNFSSIELPVSVTNLVLPQQKATTLNQQVTINQASIKHNVKQDPQGQSVTQSIQTNQGSIQQSVNQTKKQLTVNQKVQGFDGTVKVGDVILGNGPDGNKGNKPHLPCTFQIEAYGFGASVSTLSYEIVAQAPSQPKGALITNGDISINTGKDFNGKAVIDLSSKLDSITAHDKQGAHVKVKVTYDGQVSNGYKSKVFWVKCETKANTDTNIPTPDNSGGDDENGQTLSTNTKKTGVLGTSIDRTTESLPSTGGVGMALAQAFGLFLIVVGAVVAHVRRIQAKIEAQMSV